MALEEFTVDKNTGYVGQATADMHPGQIDEIERKARAQVVTAEVNGARSQEVEKAAAGQQAHGTTEGRVYGDMIADSVGLKTISTLVEAVGTRLSDRNSLGVHENNTPARHIDSDIQGAARAPGVYRAEAAAKPFGAVRNVSGGSDLSNLGIGERVGLTGASLTSEKDTGNLSTWAQKPFESAKVEPMPQQVHALKLQSDATLAKQTTFSMENANEQALTSVKLAREQQSAYKGMAPPGFGFDLSNGPRFNHSQFLNGTTEDTGSSAA